MTSQSGLSSLRKRYSLEITHPPKNAGETPLKIDAPELRVEWRLIERSITGEQWDLHNKGAVSVLEKGSTQPKAYPSSDGWAVVRMGPGSNHIKIVSEVDGSTEAAIDVEGPDNKPPNAATPPKADRGPGKIPH